MEKSLRILGLIGVIGSVAIVAAQTNQVRQPVGERAQSVTQAGAGQVAAPTTAYRPDNSLQRAMRYHMSNLQNLEIETAKEQGKDQLVDDIIKVNCYYTLATMRPDQQKHEMTDVWQVQQFVPNDPGWKAVCAAPTMVKEVLALDAKVDQKIGAAMATDVNVYQKLARDISQKLSKEPGFDSWPQEVKVARFKALYDAEKAKLPARTPAQNYADACKRSAKILNDATAMLRDSQSAEVHRIFALYDADMKRATSGARLSFLKP